MKQRRKREGVDIVAHFYRIRNISCVWQNLMLLKMRWNDDMKLRIETLQRFLGRQTLRVMITIIEGNNNTEKLTVGKILILFLIFNVYYMMKMNRQN